MIKPERNYLIKVMKPVVKSPSAQAYVKKARTNSYYRRDNAIHMPRAIKKAEIIAELSQHGDSFNVYAETTGSRDFLYEIKLSEFEEPKSTPKKEAPAKAQPAKTAPAKKVTKKPTRTRKVTKKPETKSE